MKLRHYGWYFYPALARWDDDFDAACKHPANWQPWLLFATPV